MQRPRRRLTGPEREQEKFVDGMMYLLTAPLIGYPPYHDNLQRHVGDMKLYRLARGSAILEEQMASIPETCLYLSTASLNSPMGRDWTDIYGWCFCQWRPEEGKAVWGDKPMELGPDLKQDLDHLRRWLFRRQMEHVRRSSAGAKEDVAVASEDLPTDDEGQQMSLF